MAQGSGFKVSDFGLRFQGSGFKAKVSGFRVQDIGCSVEGRRVEGSHLRGEATRSAGDCWA